MEAVRHAGTTVLPASVGGTVLRRPVAADAFPHRGARACTIRGPCSRRRVRVLLSAGKDVARGEHDFIFGSDQHHRVPLDLVALGRLKKEAPPDCPRRPHGPGRPNRLPKLTKMSPRRPLERHKMGMSKVLPRGLRDAPKSPPRPLDNDPRGSLKTLPEAIVTDFRLLFERFSRARLFRLLMAQSGLSSSQTSPGRPKKAPRLPKLAPRRPKRPPRRSKIPARSPQDCPEWGRRRGPGRPPPNDDPQDPQ